MDRKLARAEVGAAASDLLLTRYELVKELGHGGMARVWAVRELKTGRAVALKRLSASAERRHVALFEREYYTLAGLHHPSIVEVYDYAIDPKGPYYTMELLSGSDLSSLAPRPFVEVCQILRDAASALALLHARRFLHRDVSARNVWLTPDGRVKLIDFGTLVPFGRSRDVAGTPPFIAPEAVHGYELDQRTDLYSLGARWLSCRSCGERDRRPHRSVCARISLEYRQRSTRCSSACWASNHVSDRTARQK
jgi:serine/threonine-protein kinase